MADLGIYSKSGVHRVRQAASSVVFILRRVAGT
jgi:hypothetical protein